MDQTEQRIQRSDQTVCYSTSNLCDSVYNVHDLFRLVGDVLLATGFLSYNGPFNQEFRLLLIDTWKKEIKERSIPYTANINLIEMLISSSQVHA